MFLKRFVSILFFYQVNLLTKFGLKPDGILGHSVGELVCGYADGCLDEGQTILAAFFRGQ